MNTRAAVLMMPLSTVYRAVTEVRHAAYRSGLFRISALEKPVISVGNITTGGTGKTPLVEWVCRTISSQRCEDSKPTSASAVWVLTRGYGKADPKAQVLVSDGKQILATEREAGDEPLLLAMHLVGIASVVSNPDRVAAGEWAIRELGAEVFVLDDGFQHLRLARDLDLVTIDATNPFGGGELLPHGRLREAVHNLARADAIVLTRSDQANDLVSVKNRIRELVPDRPLFMSRMETAGFRDLNGVVVDADEISKHRVVGFCGVGNPDSFVAQIRSSGAEVIFSRSYPDHHRYTAVDLKALANDAKSAGATCFMTTAKDATKLSSDQLPLPCFVLEIEIKIDDETRLASLISNAISQRSTHKLNLKT